MKMEALQWTGKLTKGISGRAVLRFPETLLAIVPSVLA